MSRFLVLVLLSCTLGVLSGCSDPLNDVDNDARDDAPQLLTLNGNKNTHLFIGTGSVQGVYFPIGGVICRLLNRDKARHRIRCSLESTGGSVYNLKELRAGNFDLVFAQSDWQFHAYHGTSAFQSEGPNPDLRAVFALEPDPIVLLVDQSSDIESFDDLAGKTVSFGYTRSIQHRIMDDFLEVKQWGDKNFAEVRPMSDSKQLIQLCDGLIDAGLLISSSLTDYLAELPPNCDLRMVSITGQGVDDVIRRFPYYRTGTIPKGLYLDAPDQTTSFGLGATFVALESTSPKAIYHVVKEVVENFRDFKSLHPSLSELDQDDLSNAGISIPLHPGAIRYYKEARLLK